VAYDDGPLDSERFEERRGVSRQIVDPVAALWTVRLAESALVGNQRVKAAGQEGEYPAVGEPGVGPSVKEEDHGLVGIALLSIVESWATRKHHGA
jgi:hypothetical protein